MVNGTAIGTENARNASLVLAFLVSGLRAVLSDRTVFVHTNAG
jgi:hypothetical protein